MEQKVVVPRNRQRSVALSYDLIKQIRDLTKDTISVSGFIRMAVLKEIERQKKR